MPLDQNEAPYLDALRAYVEREPGRFHIPGHKGGIGADPGLIEAVGERALAFDIPALIEGIDVGALPIPFGRAQELAADAWGAHRSWFLINGASQGNQAACLALRQSGEKVAVQRNVHSSTIDGIVLAGLAPTFVAPEIDPELGIANCITAESLEAALTATPGAVAAMVVSPTYFGAVADVAALAEVAHSHGVPLVVDEAWGAHLRFSDELPPSALGSGADVVLSSVHKLIGSMTQSAILHVGRGGRIDEAAIDRGITLLESTSPSALLGASLDAARRMAATRGAELLHETIASLREAREEVRSIPGFDVLDERLAGRPGVAGWDPLRFTIDVRATGHTGMEIARRLLELDDINLELAGETVIVAAFGMGEPVGRTMPRLLAGLRRIADELGAVEPEHGLKFAPPPPWGPLRMRPREAFLAPQEAVAFEDSVGRIAAEALATYPPGIPNVLPGELLTRETLDYITEALAHGGRVRGAVDRTLGTIRVVRDQP